ncbi:hypothetical protein PsYK624_025330 [Phanerochaete sordida]|uniref:Uncharacterized protein n=1 Tax=Phanerochaete sordida TaxID=48140 RepID=A0A9P3G1D0_9APHY|nr:hypothetical protein PsYK624_025330 [Phanerochaete sordida]
MCTRMAPEIVMFPSSPLSHSEPAFQGVFRAVPEGPSPRGGSFQFDSRPNRLPLEWSSEAEFHSWLAAEQASNSVEFVVRNTRYPKSDALKQLWTKEITYVCGRAATGGRKSYIKKTSREQKLSSKKIPGGCTAKIVFKSYPTTLSVRGKYISSHTHATGDDNLKFTRVSRETRARIAALLRQGLEPKLVVSTLSIFLREYP